MGNSDRSTFFNMTIRFLFIAILFLSIGIHCTIVKKCKNGNICIIDPSTYVEDDQHFKTINSALENCNCPFKISDHLFTYHILCKTKTINQISENLNFYASPNITLNYKIENCTLSNANSWKLIPSSNTLNRFTKQPQIKTNKYNKYGSHTHDNNNAHIEEPENKNEYIKHTLYNINSYNKGIVDFYFKNVKFKGLSTEKWLFSEDYIPVDSKIYFNECEIHNYIGEYFLKMEYMQGRSEIHVINSFFRNIKGYAIHSKGLQSYNITNNLFSICGGRASHSCLYLHTNYAAINSTIIVKNNTYNIPNNEFYKPFKENSTVFHLHHIEDKSAYEINISNNTIDGSNVISYGIWIQDCNGIEKYHNRNNKEFKYFYEETNIIKITKELNNIENTVKYDIVLGESETKLLKCENDCIQPHEITNTEYCIVSEIVNDYFHENFIENDNITTYNSIQESIDDCIYDLILVKGNSYPSNGIKFNREGLTIISLEESVIMGTGHLIAANNVTIRGFKFQNVGGYGIEPFFSIVDGISMKHITLMNNEFIGLGVRVLELITGSLEYGTFEFSYNKVSNFLIKAIHIKKCKSVIMKNNEFNYNQGSSILFENVTENYQIKKNNFMKCRGSSYLLENAIVLIKSDKYACNNVGDCIFKDNVHNALNLEFIDGLNDIAYYISGGNIHAEDVKGNACRGCTHGLIFNNTHNIQTFEEYKKIETFNGFIRKNTNTDIAYINTEIKKCKTPCFIQSNLDKERYCYVDRENALSNDNMGYTLFTNVSNAFEYCPFGRNIMVKDRILRENIVFTTDTSIIGEYNSNLNGAKPIILGHGHLIEDDCNSLRFENVEFRYSTTKYDKLNNNIQYTKDNDLFYNTKTGHYGNLKHIAFKNVLFSGDNVYNQDENNAINKHSKLKRINSFSLNLNPNAVFEIYNCTFKDWPSLKSEASSYYGKILLNGKNDDGDDVIHETMAPTGGRIWLRYPIDVKNTGKISIRNSYFERIDGTSIRLENVGNYNVSNNYFKNCGGRHTQHPSVVMIKANKYSQDGEYYFQNNYLKQDLDVLFGITGGLMQKYYVSAFWLSDFNENTKIWKFTNNTCYGLPIGTRFSSFNYEDIFIKSLPKDYVNFSILSDLAYKGNNCNVYGETHDFILSDPIDDKYNKEVVCDSGEDGYEIGIDSSSCKCSVDPPESCIVDKDYEKITKNVYYKTWIFKSLREALRDCIDPYKIINVVKTISPYTEKIIIPNNGWTIKSDTGAEFMGSGNIIASTDIIIEGLYFLHLGNEPTIISAPHTKQIDFMLKSCIFKGRSTLYPSISGDWINIHIEKSEFNGYHGNNVIDIIDYGISNIIENKFIEFKECALSVRESNGYVVSNNVFVDISNDIKKDSCAVYLEAKNNIEFVNNTYLDNNSFNAINKRFSQNIPEKINNFEQLQHGVRTAFWLDKVPNSSTNNSYIVSNNNALGNIAIGMRISFNEYNKLFEGDLRSISKLNNDYYTKINGVKHTGGIHGLWHDIVEGNPEFDAKLQQYPFSNKAFICDGGCDTIEYIVIGVSAIFVVIVLCMICCCIGYGYQDPPHRIPTVWSNFLQAYIPKDKKYWPLLHYGYLPGWGTTHTRPTPSYLIDPKANLAARINYIKDMNGENCNQSFNYTPNDNVDYNRLYNNIDSYNEKQTYLSNIREGQTNITLSE